MEKRKKEYNDKNYNQFGKAGWCLHEKVTCYGNCTECTLRRFPELEKDDDEGEYYDDRSGRRKRD